MFFHLVTCREEFKRFGLEILKFFGGVTFQFSWRQLVLWLPGRQETCGLNTARIVTPPPPAESRRDWMSSNWSAGLRWKAAVGKGWSVNPVGSAGKQWNLCVCIYFHCKSFHFLTERTKKWSCHLVLATSFCAEGINGLYRSQPPGGQLVHLRYLSDDIVYCAVILACVVFQFILASLETWANS